MVGGRGVQCPESCYGEIWAELSEYEPGGQWQLCLRRWSPNRELQLERHRAEHPVQSKMGQTSVPGSEARWSLVTMATSSMEYTRNYVSVDGVKGGWETREATSLNPEANLNDQVSQQASFKGWGHFSLKWFTGQMLRMQNPVLQTSLSAVSPDVAAEHHYSNKRQSRDWHNECPGGLCWPLVTTAL